MYQNEVLEEHLRTIERKLLEVIKANQFGTPQEGLQARIELANAKDTLREWVGSLDPRYGG